MPIVRVGLALGLAGALPGAPVRAQSSSVDRSLDSIVAAARRAIPVPGAVVAIVRGDSVVALRGFGLARIEDSTQADPVRSIYRLASVAKLFVTTVVLQQVERGALAFDRPVSADLPGIPLSGSDSSRVTLRHLLTHTAGFDERVIGYGAPGLAAIRPLGEYLAARLPNRGWPAGRLVGYSNHGMALAGYLAEQAAGVRFADLARRDVFEPLGMARTWYLWPPDSLTGDVATGYRCGPGGCDSTGVVWSHAYPVGLAFSTAADMTRFLRMELAGGTLAGVRVVDSTLLAEAHRRQFTHHPALPGIGLGFFEQFRGATRLLTHAGGVPGAATVLALAPAERLGVFVATNAGEPGFTRAVLDGILELFLGPVTAPAVHSSGPVAEYAGYYQLARYSHRTVERFPGVFAFTIKAWAEGDTLVVPLGSERRRFVRIDSLLLADVATGAKLALARGPDGEITHLYAGVPSGGAELPGAFERVPWYRGPYFLNEYASALAGVPILLWAGWGVFALGRGWWRRRRRGLGRSVPERVAVPAAGLGRLALAILFVEGGAFVVFVFGFVAAATRDLGRGRGIALGMSLGDLLLLRTAWLVAVAAAMAAAGVWLAWRRRWWGWVDRVWYSALAAFGLAQLHFLVWWNYLPGRW